MLRLVIIHAVIALFLGMSLGAGIATTCFIAGVVYFALGVVSGSDPDRLTSIERERIATQLRTEIEAEVRAQLEKPVQEEQATLKELQQRCEEQMRAHAAELKRLRSIEFPAIITTNAEQLASLYRCKDGREGMMPTVATILGTLAILCGHRGQGFESHARLAALFYLSLANLQKALALGEEGLIICSIDNLYRLTDTPLIRQCRGVEELREQLLSAGYTAENVESVPQSHEQSTYLRGSVQGWLSCLWDDKIKIEKIYYDILPDGTVLYTG